jgi:hypothetical protein
MPLPSARPSACARRRSKRTKAPAVMASSAPFGRAGFAFRWVDEHAASLRSTADALPLTDRELFPVA